MSPTAEPDSGITGFFEESQQEVGVCFGIHSLVVFHEQVGLVEDSHLWWVLDTSQQVFYRPYDHKIVEEQPADLVRKEARKERVSAHQRVGLTVTTNIV